MKKEENKECILLNKVLLSYEDTIVYVKNDLEMLKMVLENTEERETQIYIETILRAIGYTMQEAEKVFDSACEVFKLDYSALNNNEIPKLS